MNARRRPWSRRTPALVSAPAGAWSVRVGSVLVAHRPTESEAAAVAAGFANGRVVAP